MAINVLAKAKVGWRRFSQSSFDLDITFEVATGGETSTIKGIATKHQIQVDTDGLPFNAPNVHVTFCEEVLAESNPLYPIRDNEDVKMTGHLVSFVDSTNTLRLYKISETFPDQTVGVIVCVCTQYERNP